ncbi:MAG: aminoacyl-tRNA hydrolase [Planctomycetaceae bacterium]
MKAVVGLGNPGLKYQKTRHNVGYEVLAELARRLGGGRPTIKFEAETVEVRLGDEKVLLVAPQTYMNRSGRSVRQAVDFFKLPLDDLLIVCDDMNLDCGRLRLRGAGSAGGQKGLADIIRHLGTEAFPRLRLGIGRPPGRMAATDYVLSRFRSEETEAIEHALALAADAVETWVGDGLDAAMNRFNAASEG